MQETRKKLNTSFTLFQILAFASFAGMNYYNVYLKAIGFDSTQIGLWGSVSSIVSMVTLPLWGVISDKTRSTKLTWIISMLVFGLCYALFPLFGGLKTPIPLYLLIILYSIVKQPTHSLQDAWSISVINPFGIQYATIRKWGSFGFAVMSIIFGSIVVDTLGTEAIFYITPFFAVLLCIAVWLFKEPAASEKKDEAKKETVKINPLKLFKNYYFATAFIMVIALSIYSSLTSAFYAYILEDAGLAAEKFGIISGWGAFVQIGCMLIVTKFCKKIPAPYILIAGGLFGVAENIMYNLAENMTMMLIAGTLWGFMMAINVSVLPGYIHSLVPKEYSATAQTLSGTAVMLFSIIGSAVGGYLIKGIGIANYTLINAALQGILTILFTLTLFLGLKVFKIKAPPSVTGNE